MPLTLVVAAILGLGTIPASPIGPNPAANPPLPHVREEAHSYANQVLSVAAAITSEYVRPVTLPELVEAAAAGLYEAARKPLPADFRPTLKTAADGELLPLLIRLREDLGDHPAVREHRGLLASLRALPRVLDPYCGLIPAHQMRAAYGMLRNDSGFELAAGADSDPVVAALDGSIDRLPVGPWRFATIIPGSPAQKAGLRPGDVLTHIDGKPVHDRTAALTALARLSAQLPAMPRARFPNIPPPESNEPATDSASARLTIIRGSEPARTVTLDLSGWNPESVFGVGRLLDQSWNFFADRADKIAYIRVGAIDPSTPEELRNALGVVKANGARALVLDLRWNPGGYLDSSAAAAQLFIRRGEIATVRKRDGQIDAQFQADDNTLAFTEVPIVVLVNGETSGGGELIAAALQDHKRGVIAGQRTVGKASIQRSIDVAVPGLAFKLTSGTFVRPSGRNLARLGNLTNADDWGIRPDPGRELPIPTGLSARLKEWWQLQALRPGGDRGVLPLDDLSNDPQLQDAVRIAKGLAK